MILCQSTAMNDLAGHAGTPQAPPFVSVRSVSKSYGGAQALRGVSLSILPGHVHGLVGANGAGKSTLIRILAGLTQPDVGEIVVDGKRVVAENPHLANELGMSFIHQELAFVPGMTVLENIVLGLPKKTRFGVVDWGAIARDVQPIAERVGVRAPLNANAKGLSTAENWLVNIARALVRKSRLIVMDEPTAALSAAEAERLFSIIRDLRNSGVAVLYVSHRLDEILDLCQQVTVFRDGQSVAELAKPTLTRKALVEAIVGGAVEAPPKRATAVASQAAAALSVRTLARTPRVRNVSFELRKGEVLGLGGLVGAGRTELARLIFGADRREQGSMTLAGKPYAPRSPADAVKAGVGFVPEERRVEGLILSKSLAFNLGLANLDSIVFNRNMPFISGERRNTLAERVIRELTIKTASIETPVGRLSGGNQQKVVIGRWLALKPKVLILDEPTRGVDVGARAEIHHLIRNLASHGTAVLVISSDPEELPDLCDRALIMTEGRIVSELVGEALTRQRIIAASYAKASERNAE
jgi:ABC-type sugar transport system ATPase subunit